MRHKAGRQFTIGISEAKTSLPELVAFDQPTILLRNNEPVGAILSIHQFNEYETLRAVIADPRALRTLTDTSDGARDLPFAKLETEEDLRAAIALGRAMPVPAAPAAAAPAPAAASSDHPKAAHRR